MHLFVSPFWGARISCCPTSGRTLAVDSVMCRRGDALLSFSSHASVVMLTGMVCFCVAWAGALDLAKDSPQAGPGDGPGRAGGGSPGCRRIFD